jgi:Phage integrase family.
MSALALEVLILTATPTSEITGITWEEIDFDNQVWTIPAERMKADKEHVIPLTSRAFKIINQLSEVKMSAYIFQVET